MSNDFTTRRTGGAREDQRKEEGTANLANRANPKIQKAMPDIALIEKIRLIRQIRGA
jgi:hypothetical protein